MMKTIAFVTGSRAEYGIMRRYLKKMKEDKNIHVKLLVTGALLNETYGHQVDLIYADGFEVETEIFLTIDTRSNRKILGTMAQAMDQFAAFFEMHKYSLLIILGDRYEMFSVAVAAAMQQIPILHIHGGEATYGNYDEFIRHSITKMSLYHFTATEEYRKRVIQLGEPPQRVFCLGALGAENCSLIDESNVTQNIKDLSDKSYFVVLFHPETLTNVDTLEQVRELLRAFNNFSNYTFLFLGNNADTDSCIIRNEINIYVQKRSNALYYENLHPDSYHYLLKHSICLIGNSSSGIIEAPSLGIYTINIGERQKGRVKGNSVIDCSCSAEEISKVMVSILNNPSPLKIENPYYRPDTASRYYQKTLDILEKIEEDRKKPKYFYDLPCM